MKDFSGKVAFVTGAASGIGLGITKALASRGMRVMMADIEEAPLAAAVASLREGGATVEGVLCDVADAQAVKSAADKTIEAFGKVHVIVNNAGVGGGGGETGSIPLQDWKWTVDVNLMGVVHGCEIFLPLIKQHGEGGHVVNTASMAGHVGAPGMGPYNATKFAVVGYSESMNAELAGQNIGVSVLCPAWVNTQISDSRRNHPAGDAQSAEQIVSDEGMKNIIAEAIKSGMSPDTVGNWVAQSMEQNALYIFTHPNFKDAIVSRNEKLMAAYDAAANSDIIMADLGSMSAAGTLPQ